MAEQKRMGRPPKAAEPGTRVSLGLKVTPKVKEALDAAARANGRTQSQEAELRLESSFEDLEIVRLAVSAFNHAGAIAAYKNGHPEWKASDWIRDPACYVAATTAAVEALTSLAPKGVSFTFSIHTNGRSITPTEGPDQ